MRILLVSGSGDGAWFVWLLLHEGHKVDWIVSTDKDALSMQGLIPAPLKKVPNPNQYDLIVFDTSSFGRAADDARAVTPTIGASQFADKLEHDRIFGLEVMEKAGIRVPRWEPFDSPDKAIAYLEKNNRRYVLKPVGDAPSDMTYVSKSAEDMKHFIETRLTPKVKSFVLQEFMRGIEVSTEGWWTGTEWASINHDLEEKKFMAGDLGPNTGCSASCIWMPPKPTPIFAQSLDKVAPILAEVDFVGVIDLNVIATEGELFALEWTPRFGYEGTCNCTQLWPEKGFGEFLHTVAVGQTPRFEPRAKYSATIRLSVPPYPNAEGHRKQLKIPIQGIDENKLDTFVLYDVMKEDDCLHTSGFYNCIGSPIGTGETIEGAFEAVETRIKQLDIPNLQYRTDAKTSIKKRYDQLERWGWLRPL